MIQQSGNLTAFYLAILEWIETGESVFDFNKATGLCSNTYRFVGRDQNSQAKQLIEEMVFQFRDAGLSQLLPFNNDSNDDPDYHDELDKYQNPKRLQWVKDHATIK